jgi:hypothetical protein
VAQTGNKGRGKARQTKDRVLQARIPRHLDEELREHAEQLGLSVSTVVRNVLLNTFQLVEGVVVDSTKLARVIQGRKPRDPGRALPHPPGMPEADPAGTAPAGTAPAGTGAPVVGWQEAVLNLNGICDQCNCILRKGERAAVGVPTGARPVLLCLSCLEALPSAQASPSKRPTR